MGQKLITINRRRIPRAMPFPLQEPLPKSTVRPYFIGFLLVGFSPILLLVLNNQKGNAVPPHILNQDTGLLEDKEQKKEQPRMQLHGFSFHADKIILLDFDCVESYKHFSNCNFINYKYESWEIMIDRPAYLFVLL